jgi:hypothetical protein
VPYVNPRTAPPRRRPRSAYRTAGNYVAAGDLASVASTAAQAGNILSTLVGPGTSVGRVAGIGSQTVNALIGGGATLAAQAQAGHVYTADELRQKANYNAAKAARAAALTGGAGGGKIFGLPSVVVIAGGVGVAALLIMKKGKK